LGASIGCFLPQTRVFSVLLGKKRPVSLLEGMCATWGERTTKVRVQKSHPSLKERDPRGWVSYGDFIINWDVWGLRSLRNFVTVLSLYFVWGPMFLLLTQIGPSSLSSFLSFPSPFSLFSASSLSHYFSGPFVFIYL